MASANGDSFTLFPIYMTFISFSYLIARDLPVLASLSYAWSQGESCFFIRDCIISCGFFIALYHVEEVGGLFLLWIVCFLFLIMKWYWIFSNDFFFIRWDDHVYLFSFHPINVVYYIDWYYQIEFYWVELVLLCWDKSHVILMSSTLKGYWLQLVSIFLMIFASVLKMVIRL